MTARGRSCIAFLPRRNIQDGCSSSAKKMGHVLGSYLKEEQDIIQVTQPSCSPNVIEEVCLASDLPIFWFGRNFIVDASIRKILISNFEEPTKKGNLLVSNQIVIEHIGQPIVPFIKTNSDLLLQPKFSPLLYQLRHVYPNYFRFRNLKPRLNSFEKSDANIISYPNTSEIECITQCIVEWRYSKSGHSFA